MNENETRNSYIFYGRRKGRSLSKSCQLALIEGVKYLIKKEELSNIVNTEKRIILEIGFGDGKNLINSARINTNALYIGADPFLNTTARCLHKLLKYNLNNVVIWPDDVRKILKYFPRKSISEIKILFPDPWPKKKHQNRRLIQDEFLKTIGSIMKNEGTITIATDEDRLKRWILEKFQKYKNFEWEAKCSKDWQSRPIDCYETKYEFKSIIQKRNPSWFVFKKK